MRGRVFRGRAAVEAGLLTERQLQSRAWRRLFQGIYADSAVTVTHEVRCAVAADFVLPPDGVIAGRSAATIYGVGIGSPDDEVEAVVSGNSPMAPWAGVIVHRTYLPEDERRRIRGLVVTDPARTCWDLARWLSPVEAVVLVDRMLASGVVTAVDLIKYLRKRGAERPHPLGLRRYIRVLRLADPRAGSPQESRLRARLVLAGLPPPRPQYVVVDGNGQFVARLDLAWDEAKVALEYDGLWHVGSGKQMHYDRKRLNALAAQGWMVLHVTSERLRSDFPALVREIRAAFHRPTR